MVLAPAPLPPKEEEEELKKDDEDDADNMPPPPYPIEMLVPGPALAIAPKGPPPIKGAPNRRPMPGTDMPGKPAKGSNPKGEGMGMLPPVRSCGNMPENAPPPPPPPPPPPKKARNRLSAKPKLTCGWKWCPPNAAPGWEW
jgi:hypothetical protein